MGTPNTWALFWAGHCSVATPLKLRDVCGNVLEEKKGQASPTGSRLHDGEVHACTLFLSTNSAVSQVLSVEVNEGIFGRQNGPSVTVLRCRYFGCNMLFTSCILFRSIFTHSEGKFRNFLAVFSQCNCVSESCVRMLWHTAERGAKQEFLRAFASVLFNCLVLRYLQWRFVPLASKYHYTLSTHISVTSVHVADRSWRGKTVRWRVCFVKLF